MKIIRKIILVVICVILVDYIYQYNQFQKYNQAPLIIKTPEGSNQPYHPSVIYIPEGWNGYKYWMAETPYPLGEDGDWKGLPPYRERWENPCVHVSKDGIHWNDFEDSQNPIDDLDENNIINKDYFSSLCFVADGQARVPPITGRITVKGWRRIVRVIQSVFDSRFNPPSPVPSPEAIKRVCEAI